MDTKEWKELKSILLEIKEDVSAIKAEKEKELLTPKEVQEILKIGKTTYQRYIDNKVLRQVKIGGKAYVERLELERKIDEGKI